ncbi:hypothetical protein [Amycolatopsis sp. NPDC004079]|uniref:hypothetical protein n=1 Tax=Amycolatopsis sp. NPDC004079 TaxID=3154549 RepID=UPI0033A6979F
MRANRSRGAGDALFGNAGWLFADLMLALVATVFIATTVTAKENEPPKPPPVTASPSPKPPPSPKPQPAAPPALLPQPVEMDLTVDTAALIGNDRAAVDAMTGAVRNAVAARIGGHRVGVVLTFGTAPSNQIGRATSAADHFNDLILKAWAGPFSGAVYRGYFQGGSDLNKISLTMFVYNH